MCVSVFWLLVYLLCVTIDIYGVCVCACVCMCMYTLWGGAEHQCVVLAGLAVQHVEQAQTRFHGERAITPTTPLHVHIKHTHNKKDSSRLPRLVQHTHTFSLFFSVFLTGDKVPKVRTE